MADTSNLPTDNSVKNFTSESLANFTVMDSTECVTSSFDVTIERLDRILFTVTVVLIMFSMGCVTEVSKLWENIRRPWWLFINVVGQFFIMPLVGAVFIVTLNLPPMYAVGTIVIASCPGGPYANNFSYLTLSDVSLSISLTACSSVLVIGGLPLMLALYSHTFVDDGGVVPVSYDVLCVASVKIIVPAVSGVLIRWKLPRLASVIEKSASIVPFGLLTWIIQKCFFTREIFTSPWQVYAIAAVFPIIAVFVGFTLSSLFCVESEKRRTVAIETGCQNVGLASAVITVSDVESAHEYQLLAVPLLYGVFLFSYAILIIPTYRLIQMRQDKSCEKDDIEKFFDDSNENIRSDSDNSKYGSVEKMLRGPVKMTMLPREPRQPESR
ncbi:ileal sodium/bile acid cotransporter-like [Ptychodera flava]|uniref:ileal sodium/bile acid cotransporter-like n=1 Tax=Ptychodera flava TaxID=63121 RepID=UPI00396AA92C